MQESEETVRECAFIDRGLLPGDQPTPADRPGPSVISRGSMFQGMPLRSTNSPAQMRRDLFGLDAAA